MSDSRFVIKYCNILDSVFVIDTLKRMPLTMVIDKVKYVHGLDCNDHERAEKVQRYYENLCGFQRSLFQEVHSFTIQSHEWLGHYGSVYQLIDNTGKEVIHSFDKSVVLEFKEWLEMEVKQ